MANININAQNRLFETEPSLYGLFFEDINRSADGGLYPELLRNRAFEDSCFPEDLTLKDGDLYNETGWRFEYQMGEGQKRWKEKLEPTSVPAWYSKNAVIKLNKLDTLNTNRTAALDVSFYPGGSVYNIGFSGVPVKASECYQLYFFAKADSKLELMFSIEADDKILCSSKIVLSEQNEAYKKYSLTLKSTETCKKAVLRITSSKGGSLRIGFISLMPVDTYRSHGLRKDLCEKLEGLHPAFLRFPGGCIVEGFSKSTAQKFKRMVGPVWERQGFLNMWGYRSTEGLGYHEYLQLCEDLKVDALYVCNVGMTCQARNCILMDENEIDEYLEDVLCALEYALGAEDTMWGQLRSKMGHPQPFGLKYLEIGNENNGSDYEARYKIFADVICEKYPDLIIVANTHVEKVGLPLDIADEHFYDKTEWFAQNSHYYDNYDRNGPKIFVGEYAVVAGAIRTLYAALGEAMFMIGMERNQDIVALSAYAPLFENVNYAAWEPNLIAFDGLDNYAIPSYYVTKLFAENKGKYVLESSQCCKRMIAPHLKGGPCIVGSAGLKFKNAKWKGETSKATIELFGHVNDCLDGTYVTEILSEEANSETAIRFEMENTVMVMMSDDITSVSGVFELDILAEPDKEIGIGLFTAPYGKGRNSDDSPWNLFSVQPIRWCIANGVSRLIAGIGFRKYDLSEAVPIDLEMGAYHKMQLESDGTKLRCIINGEEVMAIDLPNYDILQSIALEDEEEIIIKIVNIADEEVPVNIAINCNVQSQYSIGTISGNPSNVNTLDDPESVVDSWKTAEGASAKFAYLTPANSVNVLRLKRPM